mgnify:CR=1 FL=1
MRGRMPKSGNEGKVAKRLLKDLFARYKKEFLEKDLSKELEEVIENKEVFKSKENNEIAIPITQNEGRERIYNSQVIYPIITDGDVVGTTDKVKKVEVLDVEEKVFEKTEENLLETITLPSSTKTSLKASKQTPSSTLPVSLA